MDYKNTLWSFGDSFTQDIKERIDNQKPEFAPETYKMAEYYIKNYGYDNLISHQIYLAEYLNFKNKIVAKGGDSNYHILNNVLEHIDEIKKGDVVIVQWTMLTRFGLPIDEKDDSKLVSTRLDNTHQNDISEESLSRIFTYRDTKSYYKKEIYLYTKLIKKLSKLIGFDIYFWSLEPKILQYFIDEGYIDNTWFFYPIITDYKDYRDYFREHGVKTHTEECNNQWNDVHYGVGGNKRQYELFRKYIDENISYRR